jgi:hypothetical protein
VKAAGLVYTLFNRFPVEQCVDLIEELSGLDRFQASQGIEEAAQRVADAAQRAGLKDVEILRLPADGTTRWGSFRAPRSWTPLVATLDVLGAGQKCRVISFPDQPCTLATYSAPTPPEGVRLPLVDATFVDTTNPAPWPDIEGAFVLLPTASALCGMPMPLLTEGLTRSGAVGFATDAASAHLDAGSEAAGRIELSRDARLFGFSVGPAAMDTLVTAAHEGHRAEVRIDVNRDAGMPLVHGSLPGDAPEILLHAHLCHPRPAANDNGSGIAALLGIAEVLSGLDNGSDQRGVRFLWAPEFAGTAAFLHELVAGGPLSVPMCAINLDMVGEDQARCGGPMIVEQPPAHIPSYLPALAEDFLSLLPSPIRSYSGAVELRDWQSVTTPFVGASDHALFSDTNTMCQAICIAHWPDRFRHSALDTPDKVSPDELRRTSVLAASLAAFLRVAGAEDLPYLYSATTRWASGQMLRIARQAASRPPSSGTVFDPFAPAHVRGFLQHQARQAFGAMTAAGPLAGASGITPPVSASTWLNDQAAGFARWAIGSVAAAADADAPKEPPDLENITYQRSWPGPFNLEGLMDAASPDDRRWIITTDHGDDSAYAQMMALAMAINEQSTFDQMVRQAAYSTWLPIDIDFAHRYLGVLRRADWVVARPDRT